MDDNHNEEWYLNMGDMADFTNECMSYHRVYEAEGNHDRWEGDGFDYNPHLYSVRQTSCKFCKTYDVSWKHTKVGWRLFNTETNDPHTCKQYNK